MIDEGYPVQELMLPKKEKEPNPMSPTAAAATVVNSLLATGPFTYPYGFVSVGPLVAAPLLFITSFFAYITATFMIEAISIAQVLDSKKVSTESILSN